MFFLCVGDIHFKKDNSDEINKLLKFILSEIKKNSNTYEAVVLLGDILHSFDKIDMWCLIRATKFIKEISEFIKVFVIIGNHDRPNNKIFCEKDVHPFVGLSSKDKNIYIIDQPYIYKEKYLFVPYIEDEKFNEIIPKFLSHLEKNFLFDVVFCHQNFKGAKFNELINSQCKEDFQSLKIGKVCVSGHIHLEQTVNNVLFYCGEKCVYSYDSSCSPFHLKCIYKHTKKSSSLSQKENNIKPLFDNSKEKICLENSSNNNVEETFEKILKLKIKEYRKEELFEKYYKILFLSPQN